MSHPAFPAARALRARGRAAVAAIALAAALGTGAAACSSGGSGGKAKATTTTTAAPREHFTGDHDSPFCKQIRTVDQTVEKLAGKAPGDVERQVQRQLLVQEPLVGLAPPEIKADVQAYVHTEEVQRDALAANGWDFSKLTKADRLVSDQDAQSLERVARYASDVCGVDNGR